MRNLKTESGVLDLTSRATLWRRSSDALLRYAPGMVRISGPLRVATAVCSYWTVRARGRL